MIEANIVLDSLSTSGVRLTTFRLRYPKFIHGELMTHRRFSRNASSSRAIPTAKYIEEVESDALRASPVFWGKNRPGMQAVDEITGEDLLQAQALWRDAALSAASMARKALEFGLHKQTINRILEPFVHINVVVSATEYINFFGLRLDAGAQPEIRALAELMWRQWSTSEPRVLRPGEWHLPFTSTLSTGDDLETLRRVSAARCARTSYLSFDTGKESTVDEDLGLCQRLMGAQPLHASPFEHQATPDLLIDGQWESPELHGNFGGWCQYRKMFSGEDMAPLPKEYEEEAARFALLRAAGSVADSA